MFLHLVGNERLGGLDQTQLPLDQGKEIETLSKHTRLATQLKTCSRGENNPSISDSLMYTQSVQSISTEIEKKSIKES